MFSNLHTSSMVNCDDNKKSKTSYNYKELGCETKYNKTNCKKQVKNTTLNPFHNSTTKKQEGDWDLGIKMWHVQLTQEIDGSIMHYNKCWESWCVIHIGSQWQKYFHAQSTREHNVNGNWYNGNWDYNIWNKV